MKSIKTYIFIALTGCVALCGCEMKNELMGERTENLPQGKLELGVALKKVGIDTQAVRAQGAETDRFPVSITGTSEGITEVKKEYAQLTEVPKPLELPVGTYTVAAHSPMELLQQMEVPYYAGEQTMVIQKATTTQTTVKCTMQNSRIALTYGEDFKKSFTSWTITLDDGLNHVLTYTHENLNPAEVYWLFEKDKVKQLTANITAVTANGNTVTATRKMIKEEAAKPQGIDEIYFKGGDAILIPMGVEESPEGNVTGITLKPSINFDSDNKDEFVELPTVDETPQPPVEPEQPTPPAGNEPTLNFEKGVADIRYINDREIEYSLQKQPAKFDAALAAPAGFEKIVVMIEGGNKEFDAILADLQMDGQSFLPDKGGVNIIGNTQFNELLAGQGLAGPTKGSKEYTFPIGAFFQFLNLTGVTDTDKAHTFTITLTDAQGKTCADTLKIHIVQ